MSIFLPEFKGKCIFLSLVCALAALFPEAAAAQPSGAATQVFTVPSGLTFQVDGQSYTQPMSAMWPAGSKHTLWVQPVQSSNGAYYIFNEWIFSGGNFVTNPITVTADPSITQFSAVFGIGYDLSIRFNSCTNPATCTSPGTIMVNAAPIVADLDQGFAAGSTVILQAFPNPGWVFAGWTPGQSQVIQGLQDTITMTGPITAQALFLAARPVSFATSPPGLQVVADRTTIGTPTTLEWGAGSAHSVGAVSPQQDRFGNWWAFSSWSDGGALNHTYNQGNYGATLTATYVPAEHVAFVTSPLNLQLSVDGRTNWLADVFEWGLGETHQISAPSPQTDSQGHTWAFANWSIGGAASQGYTVASTADALVTAVYNPVAQLTVGSSMPGIAVKVDGGADCATPCQVQRAIGSSVRVSAPASIPRSHANFTGWSMNGAPAGSTGDWTGTLTAAPLSLTAVYGTMNHLSVSSDPPGAAAWQIAPPSRDGFYDAAAAVNVGVTASPGYRFRAWSGDLSGSAPSGSVLMSAPRSVKALFDSVPYIAPSGVSNAAGVTPQLGVAPGSMVSISGSNLAPATVTGPDSPLAQTLGGVTVHIGDSLLPLAFVSPGQITAQLPPNLAAGPQALAVSIVGLPDATANFTVVRDAPGLYQQAVNNQLYALALHQDGSLVTPASPASGGELIGLYGTGFGATSPARPEGFAVPANPPYVVLDAVTVSVGSASVAPENAFAAPERVGIDIVQFRLPSDAPSAANVSLQVRVNGVGSNSVVLPVK
jgi:uncharacterized protein (TIGR03437 family)